MRPAAWSLGRSSSPSSRSSPPSRSPSPAQAIGGGQVSRGSPRLLPVAGGDHDHHGQRGLVLQGARASPPTSCSPPRTASSTTTAASQCRGRVTVFSGSTVLSNTTFSRATAVALFPGLDLQATPNGTPSGDLALVRIPSSAPGSPVERHRRLRVRALGRRLAAAHHRLGLHVDGPGRRDRLRRAADAELGERQPPVRRRLRLGLRRRLRGRDDVLRARHDRRATPASATPAGRSPTGWAPPASSTTRRCGGSWA